MTTVQQEIRSLRQLSVTCLQHRYAELFGEVTRSGNRDYLIKKIAYRLQVNADGDLSERARRRAEEIANDADLRLTAPRPEVLMKAINAGMPAPDDRLPLPGSVLTREYKGRTIVVEVRGDGFLWDGEFFRSLTAVAKAVTQQHVNGYAFFGLTKGAAR